jgi:D-tagatose-1,6-bisphosphate aldolase subunit GatZ/KbaZ
MNAVDLLLSIVQENRAGHRRALPSWCTAHPETLMAVLTACREHDGPILIEATCNQVNQEGGYTGMTPGAFRSFVEELAGEADVDPGRLIFGGDHLGPNPWRRLPSSEAMRRAGGLVRAYVEAGYVKIHLDASMCCADDASLSEATIAARAAELCAVAESAAGARKNVYVIGTEVPIPGGETTPLAAHAVTPANVRRTIDLHQKAFEACGVGDAMGRAIAIVVQPGVDFNNAEVLRFDKCAAASLAKALDDYPTIAFEAHSTDFQTAAALADLVDSHFAFLKVGPELTFAFREAVLAMAALDGVMAGLADNEVVRALEGVMDAEPIHWRDYVAKGDGARIDRLFGLSDRVRYYWGDRQVNAALAALTARIDGASVPPGLLHQYTGSLTAGTAAPTLSKRIVQAKVEAVVSRYVQAACGAKR